MHTGHTSFLSLGFCSKVLETFSLNAHLIFFSLSLIHVAWHGYAAAPSWGPGGSPGADQGSWELPSPQPSLPAGDGGSECSGEYAEDGGYIG